MAFALVQAIHHRNLKAPLRARFASIGIASHLRLALAGRSARRGPNHPAPPEREGKGARHVPGLSLGRGGLS